MNPPEIYADFNNLDDNGHIRLTTIGSVTDIARLGIRLRDGLKLTLATDDADDEGNRDDLMADAVIRFNKAENCWVAQVDWDEVKNRSEREASQRAEPAGTKNGVPAGDKQRREVRAPKARRATRAPKRR